MKKISILIIIAIFLASCKSSYITSTWKAANTTPAAFHKLVVIALVGDAEQASRKLMEKHMVDDLKEMGYNAICSCEAYDPGTFKGMNEKEALARLREDNVDGILTIVLLNMEKTSRYIPPRTREVPVFWDYYRTIYQTVYTEGYYAESTKYFWESNLYDLTADRLLYSVQSQTFDPSSSASMAHQYGQMMVKKMKKEKAIEKQAGPPKKPY